MLARPHARLAHVLQKLNRWRSASSARRAAEQATLDGTNLSPVIVMTVSWDSGNVPWIRRHPHGTKVQCLFCGEIAAIVSDGDIGRDSGRVQVYCDNGACAAREIEVLVV